MKKAVFRLLYMVVFLIGIVAIGVSAMPTSYATGSEVSYIMKTFEFGDIGNLEQGCIVKGYFRSEATNIVKVSYTAVKITSREDIVTVEDNGEIFLNEQLIDDDLIVEVVENSQSVLQKNIELTVKNVANPTMQKSKYVEVEAKEWCALVFVVTFIDGDNKEAISYGTDVQICTKIDTSRPEVYKTENAIITADSIVYEIMIRGDKRDAKKSYNSGLDYFEVYKNKQKIYEKKQLNTNFELYSLAVSIKEIAEYEIRAKDKAGNQVVVKVAENNKLSYNEGMESAVINALNYLKDNKDYAPIVREQLENAYANYYLTIQNIAATDNEKSAEYNNTLGYLTEYARLKKLEEISQKEWGYSIINSDYVDGEITIGNGDRAFSALLYGEKAIVTVVLASFAPSKIDKTAEMQTLGIKKYNEVLTFNIAVQKGAEIYREKFDSPLQIAVPIKEFSSVLATITLDNQVEVVDIELYNNYIVLNSNYSYGTISLFITQSQPLLWLYLLLIIPFGAVVVAIIIIIKKRKSGGADEPPRPNRASKRKEINNQP